MIDWSRLRDLRHSIGDDDFDDVVETFVAEVEGILDRLRDAPSDADFESDLHALKGAAATLGFTAFADLCSQGENAARAGHGDGIDVAAILSAYDMSKAAFLDGLSMQGA